MSGRKSDHDYIFSLIDYLFSRYRINFFITSKDFDVLYNWWEKEVPEELIKQSMDTVMSRRIIRGRSVDSFMNFSYEVRKNIGVRFDLNINSGNRESTDEPEKKIENFFENLHPELKFLEKEFRKMFEASSSEKSDLQKIIYDRLIEKFKDNEEMLIKTNIFMNNLPEAMKKPEIIRKFRINYLNRLLGIPDPE